MKMIVTYRGGFCLCDKKIIIPAPRAKAGERKGRKVVTNFLNGWLVSAGNETGISIWESYLYPGL
jgi:hypothetical protein